MVSFELGKEVEKDVLRLQLSRDWARKRFWAPMGFDSSRGLRIFLCPRFVTRRKTSYSMQPAVIKNYEVTLKHAN